MNLEEKENINENKSVGHTIGVTTNLIGRAIAKDMKEHSSLKISPIQIEIMKYLTKNVDKKIFQKDLEQIFTIRRSTASGILKTMEKNKMIIRKPSLKDQRIKEIILTDDAKHKLVKVKKKVNNLDKLLTRNISKSDLNVFYKVMDQIQNNLLNIERNDLND